MKCEHEMLLFIDYEDSIAVFECVACKKEIRLDNDELAKKLLKDENKDYTRDSVH